MKEEDIRKRELFDRYIELVERDSAGLLEKRTDFAVIPCPACGCSEIVESFEKSGFNYACCQRCMTLYVNPRPRFEDLIDFYAKSESTEFWINDFFKPVAEERRARIFRPRAEYVSGILAGRNGLTIGDIGAGFGIFLDELSRVRSGDRLVAIEPSPRQAELCRSLGLEAEASALETLRGYDGAFDILTAFELFEHLHDPGGFLKHVFRMLKPGGRFLITTLNGMGFDILLLWEQSRSLLPPVHLNFFNTNSIATLMEKCGFEVLETTTPGQLDWDIVEGAIKKTGARPGRFWEVFAESGAPETKMALQDLISRSGLSSHMRVLVKKPD